MTTATKTMTGAEIVNMLTPKEWFVKSIRKSSNEGYSKILLTNKGDYEMMAETKTAKYFLANSRAHQIKAAIEWNRQEEWLAKKTKIAWSSACLPSTEGAVFLVRSYIRSVALLMERMVRRGDFTPAEAVELGNQILALKNQDWMFLMHIDSDPSFIREIATLQMRIGEI